MISKFFINRPIFATVIALLIVIGGLVSLHTLPIAQFPNITPPTVQVTAIYPGADAETVAQTVGVPIEEQVNGVEGMLYMSSTSTSAGVYTLTITFEVGTDVDMATVLVQNRVNIAQGNLPQAVTAQGIVTQKQSTNIVMFLSLTATDSIYDGIYLANYARINLQDELSRLSGVGDITVFGADDYSMRIWLKPEVMRLRNLTPTDVYDAIAAQNVEVAAGEVGNPPTERGIPFQISLSTQGRLTTVEEFENIVIRALPDGSFLRLKEVAEVELGAATYTLTSSQGSTPNAAIAIYQLPGSNSLEVADAVQEKMTELAAYLPPKVSYNVVLNTTEFVSASIEEVLITFLETTLLVVLVIFLFLQNLRAVVIPALTIPVSLIGTFALMKLLGFSINTLTLFGLVLAIAIVVDDAIVVVENASRILQEKQVSRKEAVIEAMQEITRPVIGVVLVLLAVFIPTALIGGVTGELYKQFALTIAVATLFSGFNSLSLTPALCALFLKPNTQKSPLPFRLFNQLYERLQRGYVALITLLLKRGVVVLALFLGITLFTAYSFSKWPSSFLPQEDQGYFMISVQLPPAASLQRTEEVATEIQELLDSIPEVATYLNLSGFSILEGGDASNGATFFVRLKDWSKRKKKNQSVFAVIERFTQEASRIEEAVIFAFNPPAIAGLGVSSGLELELQDRNNLGAAEIERVIREIEAGKSEAPAIFLINSMFQGDTPYYFLQINRNKCDMLGVDLAQLFATLSSYMGSSYVNDFVDFNRIYEVKLGASAASRARIEELGKLTVRNNQGEMVPLATLLSVEERVGMSQINRYNMYTSAAITAIPSPFFSSAQGMEQMDKLVERVVDDSFGYTWTSIAYQEEVAGSSVSLIFLLALVVVLLVLAAQYESWALPFAVIMGLPFALLGTLAGCAIMGLPISIYTQIGIILLIALSAKNGILIVEFANDYRKEKESITEAAIEAGRVRLRPILMTSLAFILGVMPLVFATGAGAESRIALGTAVVFGMGVNALLGTLFIPNFYHWMAWVDEHWLHRKRNEEHSSQAK